MIYLDPKGLGYYPFLSFLPEEARDERDWGRGKDCGIGVVKAASFLDIIYLSAVGPEGGGWWG